MPALLTLPSEYVDGLGRLIGAVRRDRLEDVDDGHDLRHKRDVIAAQPVRIAGTVQALVMMTDNRAYGLERAKIGAESVADNRVRLDELELCGLEFVLLTENTVRNGEHADVMQEAAAVKGLHILTAQAELPTEGGRAVGHAMTVAFVAAIPGLDHDRQRRDDRGGRVQIVRVPFESGHRADTCEQFAGINRLAQEIIGARLEASLRPAVLGRSCQSPG